MAKPKKYISSKLKVKRKFLLGGDPGQELYLNNNTTYQSVDAPTAMLQQQFDANEQLKAKQNTAIFGNQMARQMDYLQDLNAASEQRKKEEQQAVKEKQEANKQKIATSATNSANKIGKNIIQNALSPTANYSQLNNSSNIFSSANVAAGAPLSPTVGPNISSTMQYSHPFISSNTPLTSLNYSPAAQPSAVNSVMPQGLNQGVVNTGSSAATTATKAGVTATSYGSNLANVGVGVGLGLTGELIGYLGNKRDDKQMKQQGRSQYYDDTHYSRAEFNSQIGKSTFKGAGMGSSFGPVGTAIGAGVGLLYGTGKALHERRQTKSEDERGVKIGNKRFGKKLLFGEENVYDENLDPTVIEKRNKEAQIKAMTDTATAMDNARMGSMLQSDLNTGFNLKTTTGQMAKYGGSIKKLKGGIEVPLSKNATLYLGASHKEGGIIDPKEPHIEVEGNESKHKTKQGDYIFSTTLKLPNSETYSQAHQRLIKSGASSEEIKQLALSQEAAAGRNPNEIKTMKFAKYGGPVQYKKGGSTEPPIKVTGRSKEYWENLPVDCAKNPNQSGCYKKPKDFATSWLDDAQRYYNGELADAVINSNLSYNDFLKKFNIKSSRVVSSDERGPRTIQSREEDLINNIKSINKELNNPNISEEDKAYYKENLETIKIQLQNLDKGILPVPSREEYEFYRGQRNNPDSEIYNPANGSVIQQERMSAEVPGMGTAVEFNTNTPAGEYSAEAAKNIPQTKRGKEMFNRLQNKLKERAIQKAEDNKVYNSTELPEVTIEGSKPQEKVQKEQETPNPSMKGKDAGKLPRTEPKLATYTLPNVKVGPTSTTFVPDEENSKTRLKLHNAYAIDTQDYDKSIYDLKLYNNIMPHLDDKTLFALEKKPLNAVDNLFYRQALVDGSFEAGSALWTENASDLRQYHSRYKPEDRQRLLKEYDKNLANDIIKSGLSAEEYVKKLKYSPEALKQIGITPEVVKEILANNTSTTNPPVTTTQTQTTNNQPVTTNNNPPVNTNATANNASNNNPSGTISYVTSDKVAANKTPTGKPRFFMGASRIVDENGNIQIVTDRPLMGHGSMAGSRLGTPTEQGLEDVRYNSYETAGNLKKGAEYKNTKTGANLSSSNAVNDRETIAGTEWGKRWGYKPGMSAAEAKSAHDAFASEMRTKFDQSPEEMLGYYQYLIDSGKVDPKTGKRDYTGEDSFGDDARAIYENLQSKGYIDANGKIKSEALPYLKTQATNEFVGPIHNAAGAYTLKGKPTPVKIPGEVPETSETPETPKKPLSELPPPPKYVPTKSTNNVGLLQTIPAAYAAVNPINVKPIAPSLANGYITPGAVGRANIGRVSYNTERAANQGNLSAMNQALQNMSGPGAVAGMLAAKTKADQQSLAIANAEQNQNTGLAAKEAELNVGTSRFNVGNAMQAQTTNAGIAQQNAARMQQASQFNTQLKYAKDVENREQMLGALDRGTAAIVQNNLANRQLDATERLAGIYDAYQAYNRYLGATKKEEDKTTQTAKFGGAKKYISRLGDLKNVKYKV